VFLTLDANVFVAALKADEPYSDKCLEILSQVPERFVLVEPSIVYVEVLGALVRRVGVELAEKAKVELDRMMNPLFVIVACIPAYNEEKTIAKVVLQTMKVDRVFVCGDGSGDLTGEIAEAIYFYVSRLMVSSGGGYVWQG